MNIIGPLIFSLIFTAIVYGCAKAFAGDGRGSIKSWAAATVLIFFFGSFGFLLISSYTNEKKKEARAAKIAALDNEKRTARERELEELRNHPGKAIIDRIASRYPTNRHIKPMLWGEASTDPKMSIWLPEQDIEGLSSEDIQKMKSYLIKLTLDAKYNPDIYMTIPRSAPAYSMARENVASMRASSWAIGSGRIQGDSITIDKEVFSGSK